MNEKLKFTVVILHKDHDKRSEQLRYLICSLSNIECADCTTVIVGDEPKIETGVRCFPSKAENPFDAISELFKEDEELPEDVLIFSDDMIIANKCPIQVLMIPRFNSIELGKSSHCPIYAKKDMFTELSVPDKSIALESIINKAFGIPMNLRFPVNYKVGPLMGNFVSENPDISVVKELFHERYFIHISDKSYPALIDVLKERFGETKEQSTDNTDESEVIGSEKIDKSH